MLELMLASNILSVTQGVGKALMSGEVAKAQGKVLKESMTTAKVRADRNIKKIEENFRKQYSDLSYQYQENITNLLSKKNDVAGEITVNAASQLTNAELQGSSFYNSARIEADEEFNRAADRLVYNSSVALSELAREKEKSITEQKFGIIRAKKQVEDSGNMLKAQAKSDFMAGIGQGLMGIAKTSITYDTYKREMGLKEGKNE